MQHGSLEEVECCIMFDGKMYAKPKGKIYKTLVRPALVYGAETRATKKGQGRRLEVNEMRMLRWMCGVTKKDKIRYEHVRSKCDIRGKVDLEKRLRCYAVVAT